MMTLPLGYHLFFGFFYRLGHARSKMASPSQTSLGTETTRHCAVLRMVRWIDIDTSDALPHCSSLCLMWFNVFSPFPSLSFHCLVFFQMSLCHPVVKIVPSITSESSGLYSVKSDLSMKVVKADKDDQFYCEVTYFVPGGTRMTETNRINITVYCEFHTQSNHHESTHVSFQNEVKF